MYKSWTTGLDEEASIDVKRNFKESLVMRKRLTQLARDKVEEIRRENKLSLNSYNNPNWALLQADAAGYERALREIIKLIN